MKWLVIVALLASSAHAETPEQAKDVMREYFSGEKTGGYILAGMGAAELATGGLLWNAHCPIRRGVARSALVAGGLHLAAGIYVNVASRKRVSDFEDEIDRDGQAWVERERDRMDGVHTQFTALKIAEVVLIAGGAAGAYLAYRKGRPKLEGIAIGIASAAAMTLAFDLWASHRADDYRDDLGGLTITF